MFKIKTILSFSIIVFFGFLWLPSSQAQTAQVVVVNHVATKENADHLTLDVFFTVTDENGRPISNPNIESATIQLIGSNAAPVPATVEDPQTPIYITLLIDGSGSMKDVIDGVRNAAISAIDNAPPTAYFSVVQFNEEIVTLQDFTNDHNSVKNAIRFAESEPNKGTCLYDAVYDAVNTLNGRVQNPQDRRAIILFTDGKDQLTADSEAPCSFHSYDNVINLANPSNITLPVTPIHTIGLFDGDGGNINESELRGMAADTAAFSAIGNQTDLNGLFQEIMDGLNSQLVAQANVFAAQGENQAVLSVKVRGIDAPLTTTFNFISNTGYDAPLPPAGIQVHSLRYETDNDSYSLSLGIASVESIYQLIVNVWDVRGGTLVSADQIFENPAPTLIIELDASDFNIGREYSVHIQAKGKDGYLIENDKGETLLAESKFIYDPEPITPVEFSIKAVTPDYDSELLIIRLDVLDESRVQTYSGLVVDTDSGEAHEYEAMLFTGSVIQMLLPDMIQSTTEPRDYEITIYLMTEDQVRSESFDTFATGDRSVGIIRHIIESLINNPFISISIFVIILSIIGFFVIKKQRKKKVTPQPTRPPVDKTSLYGDRVYTDRADKGGHAEAWSVQDEDIFAQSALGRETVAPRLRLTVTQSPGSSRGLQKTITKFPCSIGRQGCDVDIVGDGRITRKHIEISLHDNKLRITDLKSSNGTFLGSKQLSPHTSAPLTGTQTLRLGTRTTVKLEVI